MIVYLAAWSTACAVALVIAALRWRSFAIARRAYVIGMMRPWKLATFALAFAGIVLVAPRSGDPTWDHWDAAFMAILVYATAPWTLGVLYRARSRSRAECTSPRACGSSRRASRTTSTFFCAITITRARGGRT